MEIHLDKAQNMNIHQAILEVVKSKFAPDSKTSGRKIFK